MKPHLGIDIRTADSYPGGVDQVKEDIGYSRYWGGRYLTQLCGPLLTVLPSHRGLPELHLDLGVFDHEWQCFLRSDRLYGSLLLWCSLLPGHDPVSRTSHERNGKYALSKACISSNEAGSVDSLAQVKNRNS